MGGMRWDGMGWDGDGGGGERGGRNKYERVPKTKTTCAVDGEIGGWGIHSRLRTFLTGDFTIFPFFGFFFSSIPSFFFTFRRDSVLYPRAVRK